MVSIFERQTMGIGVVASGPSRHRPKHLPNSTISTCFEKAVMDCSKRGTRMQLHISLRRSSIIIWCHIPAKVVAHVCIIPTSLHILLKSLMGSWFLPSISLYPWSVSLTASPTCLNRELLPQQQKFPNGYSSDNLQKIMPRLPYQKPPLKQGKTGNVR